jgi:SAM-dependent methyltransferase
MSSLSRQQLENWLKNIDVKGKVLDVGGGQKSLEGRVKSFNPQSYKILDIDKSSEPDFVCDICNNYKLPFYNSRDQIFCLEVSEYFYDPVRAIDNLYLMLKKSGELYISFHFIYPLHKPDGDDMLRYTRNWIEKIFDMIEFSKVEITDRIATEGNNLLEAFYDVEKMKYYKELDVIGYLVKATK